MKKQSITELLIFVVSAELVGTLSALISGNRFSQYSEFVKPPFSPPGALFPVIWTILYAIMGLSVYLIYSKTGNSAEKPKSYALYASQLAVNFLWSIAFFRFGCMGAAVGVLLVLIALITAMIIQFKKVSKTAAYLNLPYLIWVFFALYLNIATALLNRK